MTKTIILGIIIAGIIGIGMTAAYALTVEFMAETDHNGFPIRGVPTPLDPDNPVNKDYVDAAFEALLASIEPIVFIPEDAVGIVTYEVTHTESSNNKITVVDPDPTTDTTVSITRDDGSGEESVLDFVCPGDGLPCDADIACAANETCRFHVVDADDATQSTIKVETVADDLAGIVIIA